MKTVTFPPAVGEDPLFDELAEATWQRHRGTLSDELFAFMDEVLEGDGDDEVHRKAGSGLAGAADKSSRGAGPEGGAQDRRP
jgi:hypothetical protein